MLPFAPVAHSDRAVRAAAAWVVSGTSLLEAVDGCGCAGAGAVVAAGGSTRIEPSTLTIARWNRACCPWTRAGNWSARASRAAERAGIDRRARKRQHSADAGSRRGMRCLACHRGAPRSRPPRCVVARRAQSLAGRPLRQRRALDRHIASEPRGGAVRQWSSERRRRGSRGDRAVEDVQRAAVADRGSGPRAAERDLAQEDPRPARDRAGFTSAASRA